jgi:hypothetical protein
MKEKRPGTCMPGLLRFDLLPLDESSEARAVARPRLWPFGQSYCCCSKTPNPMFPTPGDAESTSICSTSALLAW